MPSVIRSQRTFRLAASFTKIESIGRPAPSFLDSVQVGLVNLDAFAKLSESQPGDLAVMSHVGGDPSHQIAV